MIPREFLNHYYLDQCKEQKINSELINNIDIIIDRKIEINYVLIYDNKITSYNNKRFLSLVYITYFYKYNVTYN